MANRLYIQPIEIAGQVNLSSIELLEQAKQVFMACQVVHLNDRAGHVASLNSTPMDNMCKTLGALDTLNRLLRTTKALLILLSHDINAQMHLPVIRARIPDGIKLVLNCVENQEREFSFEEMSLLTMFEEYYNYAQFWDEIRK